MRYRTNQKYSFSCTYMILIFILLCISADVVAQQEMTREERIKSIATVERQRYGIGKRHSAKYLRESP